MAWTDSLLQASFKGIAFDVLSIDDATVRALALHEFPYTDGAQVEDLGQGPKHMRFTAIVANLAKGQNDYEARLETLVKALATGEPGELVHPVLGTIARAICTQWSTAHDAELRDGCKLQLEFVESAEAKRVFEAPSPVLAAEKITALASVARAGADKSLLARVNAQNGGAVSKLLGLKTAMTAALDKLKALTDTTALKTLLSGLDPVFYPMSYVADARNVLDRALQGLPFGGRNILFDALASLNSSSATTPAASSGLADFNRAAVALSPAAIALPAPSADALVVQAHARVYAACTLAEAAAIVLVGELDETLLDLADVEHMVEATRSTIQSAIESMRAAVNDQGSAESGAALRALAYQVQQAGTAVIALRPPVVERQAPVAGPLRLVAHVLYGSHARAAELVRLNAFGRELGVTAGQRIKTYAS